MKWLKKLKIVLVVLLVTGCHSSSVDQDIKKNSDVSESLEVENNQEVKEGGEVSVDMESKTSDIETSVNKENIKIGIINAGVAVHDPSVIKSDDGKYYIFGSHMATAYTNDLRKFTKVSEGTSSFNPLFDNLFTELEAFDYVGKNEEGGYSVWAPDVIYNKAMDKYVMYFCTTSSYIKSSLCMATSDDIAGPYSFEQVILSSGFTPYTIDQTDVYDYVSKGDELKYFTNTNYNNQLWPNAIDPNVFYDGDNRMWLVYGSWSGGIFLLEIEESTGLPIHPQALEGVDSYFGKHLIGGNHRSVEAPYVLYDQTSGYYYLFVSYGSLIREGGYQIRMYRSDNPDGPYVDLKGQTLAGEVNHQSYGVKLMGNYRLSSLLRAYMAPGHNSAMIDDDGKMFLVYHTRFEGTSEGHEPRVHQMFKNAKDWLVVAPYAYSGEILNEKGYESEEVVGTYYIVNHSTDISKLIQEPSKVEFISDGIIMSRTEGKKSIELGNWQVTKNTPYITITLMNETYDGVMVEMEDEGGTKVLTFSAVSSDNKALWGVNNNNYMK